jgi:hypothetical protein
MILTLGITLIFFQVKTHLTVFQKSTSYADIEIHNHLSADIKDLTGDIKSFKKH